MADEESPKPPPPPPPTSTTASTASSISLGSAEETHAFLSKDPGNAFLRRTWPAGEDADETESDDGFGGFGGEDLEEDEFAAASAAAAADSLLPALSRATKKRLASLCAIVCVCGFVAIVVTGSWLAAAADTANASGSQLAGYALLTVAGILVLFFLVICCMSCMGGGGGCCGRGGGGGGLFGGGGGGGAFRDEFDADDVHQRRTRPKFIFKLWGDDLRLDLQQHEQLLKGTLKTLPKPVLAELAKALKQKRDRKKKEREATELALKDQVVAALAAGGGGDPLQVVRDLRKRIYVVDFVSGHTSVDAFAAQVTLVCKVANNKQDIVLFRITSPGGYVSEYGLAASHLVRVKQLGFRTIACVDTVAASGGFMLCCVCHEVYAAPFAYVGSIGVITYVPNLERVTRETLKVDVHQFTAGKHKRTVDMFGEVTEEGKAKLKEELKLIHDEFKNHVKLQRGSKLKRDIDDVATGEAWLAVNALELGLVDRIITSDQVLLEFSTTYDVLVVTEFQPPKPHGLKEMFGVNASSSWAANLVTGVVTRLMGGGGNAPQVLAAASPVEPRLEMV